MYLASLCVATDALSLDEYEELARVARERQEIVAKYDKVTHFILFILIIYSKLRL